MKFLYEKFMTDGAKNRETIRAVSFKAPLNMRDFLSVKIIMEL